MFWTRWVRGFCAALVIAVVAASVYYGREVMQNVGGDDGYYKGMGIIAVALIGSLTVVSLIMMISEIAISLNEVNKKLDKIAEQTAEQEAKPQAVPYYPQYPQYPPMNYMAPIMYQQPQTYRPQYAAEEKNKNSGRSWVCDCGNKNSGKAKFCGKCGTPRDLAQPS